jgi:hypothetical protein
MNFQTSSAFLPSFSRPVRAIETIVPAYTPMWYATKVMSTSANNWWDGGVPPARRGARGAANEVAGTPSRVARRLQETRSPAFS